MADLSITTASVQPASGATLVTGTAGAAVSAGQPIYRDSSDGNKLKPADANSSEATAAAVGIAVNNAADEQPVTYITRGTLVTDATTVQGTVYVASANPGGIAPASDLASGHYTTLLAVASDTTGTLAVHMHRSGIQW